MTQRMLIDASHPEETRVAILDGNRLEAFDFESAARKQLKGNIYLAKVTRVEPSLQACFVDYGGNRQGFLAFSEIHPDYYQIPIADREALLAQAQEDEDEAEAAEEAAHAQESTATDETPPPAPEEFIPPAEGEAPFLESAPAEITEGEQPAEIPAENAEQTEAQPAPAPVGIETVGGDEAEEARSMRRVRFTRRYKIQEVIKRRQIILVQVVKEERGAKGAALTTYMSLAGRYCVLMPNSAKSGVSRKISNYQDRRRLKSLLSDLEVPEGMAVILRTAGADRPKTDIKRDCDYLLKIWDDIRETTLQSTAPALIYEEGNLVKRAVRDLYSRDIEQIIIEGEEGYKTAKNLMKILTPSHAKKVQLFKDKNYSLLQKYQVESQIDGIHESRVELPSGGYIIIDQTEALVAIDVNSGRSTRERNIEETAYRTNLEAAEEIARQMRLRDLAGLIVVDFIDMEHHSNKVQVERRFKEAVRKDRARMQIGRISHFGLLELTRQRLRPSVLETSTNKCPSCNGSGIVRSTESSALTILRAIEEDLGKRRSRELKVFMATSAAMYLLNHKRAILAELEQRHDCKILLQCDDHLIPPTFHIERVKAEGPPREERKAGEDIVMDDVSEETEEEEIESAEEETSSEETEETESTEESGSEERHQRHSHNNERGDRGPRRRGRRRGGRGRYNNDRGDRNNNRNFHGNQPHQGGEIDGNVIPAEDHIDDNVGNRAEGGENNFQGDGQNSGERGQRNGRERYRGRRGGRNRFRRGGRDRDQNQGQRHAGGENQNHGGHHQDGGDFAAEAPSYTPPSYAEPAYTPPAPQPESSAAAERADPNVAVVTGTPDNPKRGWWKRI